MRRLTVAAVTAALVTAALVTGAPAARAQSRVVTGADAGAGPHVKVFDGLTAANTASFFAYTPSFLGGVRVAAGDVDGDGIPDIITGAGAGATPHVKVFSGASGAELASFFAYGPGFTGGVFVAAGDVNGDGRADIITGTDAGFSGGHVKVIDGTGLGAVAPDGTITGELRSFLAFPGFTGGVRVAAGDVNGDGRDDVIVGSGAGAPGGHVKVFDGLTGAEIRSFLAYSGFSGGVYVGGGDVNDDGFDDIITGAGPGSVGGHVKVFDGQTGAEIRSFLAYGPSFTGGVRVGAADVNGDLFADIIVGAGPGAPPHVKIFDGSTTSEIQSFFAYDATFTGGVFVAGANVAPTAVPEPGSASLLALGGGGLLAVLRRRRRGA